MVRFHTFDQESPNPIITPPFLTQGSTSSKQNLDKALADCNEPILGLENFGNTCYANSVLQALYFCRPFRDKLLEYAACLPKDTEENLLTCLAELFVQVGHGSSSCLPCAIGQWAWTSPSSLALR